MDKKSVKQTIIELKEIDKWYRTKAISFHALKKISASIDDGEFVAIMGTSGSGKSTLMNIIGCLDNYDGGKYSLCGKEVKSLTDKELAKYRGEVIGFIFQSFNLINRYSVLDNVSMPNMYVPTENAIERAKDLLKKVGLESKMSNKPNELSGGQRQRVAIARALMVNPEIILADEPTGNLDSKSGKDIMQLLTDLNKEGKTVVVITHDQYIADYADRIIYLQDGEIINKTKFKKK